MMEEMEEGAKTQILQKLLLLLSLGEYPSLVQASLTVLGDLTASESFDEMFFFGLDVFKYLQKVAEQEI